MAASGCPHITYWAAPCGNRGGCEGVLYATALKKVRETEWRFRAHFIVNIMPAVFQLNSVNLARLARLSTGPRACRNPRLKCLNIDIKKCPKQMTDWYFRAHFIVNMPAIFQQNSGNFGPKIRALQPSNLIFLFVWSARIRMTISGTFHSEYAFQLNSGNFQRFGHFNPAILAFRFARIRAFKHSKRTIWSRFLPENNG